MADNKLTLEDITILIVIGFLFITFIGLIFIVITLIIIVITYIKTIGYIILSLSFLGAFIWLIILLIENYCYYDSVKKDLLIILLGFCLLGFVFSITHAFETAKKTPFNITHAFETTKKIIYSFNRFSDESREQSESRFSKPIQVIVITEYYGPRIHPITRKRSFHSGIDLRGPIGTKIYASKGGVVTFAGNYKNSGNLVVIKHEKGYLSRYSHLHSISVKVGQKISSQMIIGTLGKTGRVTGPHLHFEIWKNNQSINPRDVTDFN